MPGLSSSTNSVRIHFRERVEKTKENATKTKIETLQNGHEKYGGKKFKKYHKIFKFQFEIALNGYLDKFRT